MVPGLRKRGILQMLTSKVKDTIGGLKKGGPEKPKIN